MTFSFENHLEMMLQAKSAGFNSTCSRRKIGVYIPVPGTEDTIAIQANNNPQSICQCCMRESNVCPAIHAEVNAVMNLGTFRFSVYKLYIWAETPCHQCLSFIRRYSHITDIYCLTTESYGIIYPRVLDRTSEIRLRDEYADSLGFQIHKLDVKEILDYGKRKCNNNEEGI